MRTTAAFLALAAAVPATGAASPSFATGATPVGVLGAAGATQGAATGERQAATGDHAEASQVSAQQLGANDFAMPPEMIEKLSPEQIISVLREREMRRPRYSTRPPDILATTLFFGSLVAMVLLAQIYATRRERIRQETARAMVDKGMDVPPDLIVKRTDASSDLRRGLVLVGAGLGLSLVFAVVRLNGQSGSGLWSIGLVPILMGIGYLVVWRIETRNTSGAD
jgi:hypothetical protein